MISNPSANDEDYTTTMLTASDDSCHKCGNFQPKSKIESFPLPFCILFLVKGVAGEIMKSNVLQNNIPA